MIPKIIHYCWLSDGPMPENLKRYIDGWQQLMPDYEIRRWDFSRFPRGKSAWVDEAFDRRKFAFAADLIRNYALYTEGGIYLDADVEVLKRFDSLLHLPYFLGYENGSGCIEAAVMGSEPGNPVFGRMVEYYNDRHFVKSNGKIDDYPLPKVMMRELADYRMRDIQSVDEFSDEAGVINLLPPAFFSPLHIETRRLEHTGDTYCIHRFAASWQPWYRKIKRYIKTIVGPSFTGWVIKTKRRLLR